MKQELKCIFCGLVTGEIENAIKELSVIDVRCDTHRVQKGEFKDLELRWLAKGLGTSGEFLKFHNDTLKSGKDVQTEVETRKVLKIVV